MNVFMVCIFKMVDNDTPATTDVLYTIGSQPFLWDAPLQPSLIHSSIKTPIIFQMSSFEMISD